MKLEQSFEVAAPLQRVWEALIDVERVAPCLPGATVTGRNDDGSYNGEFKVKIGPTSAAYSGKLNMESVDEDSHHATMQAAGTDKRGQGGAKATIESSVEEIDAGTTKVNVSTDYHITGRLARFGRGGMIEEISNRLLREFATNLQTMLTGDWEGAAETAATADVDCGRAPQAAAGAAPRPPPPAPRPTAAGTAAAARHRRPTGAADAEPPTRARPTSRPSAGGLPGRTGRSGARDRGDPRGRRGRAGAERRRRPGRGPVRAAGAGAAAVGHRGRQRAAAAVDATAPPPPDENEPMHGLSLVGGAVLGQIKRNAIPLAGALVAILVALGLLRRRR